MIGDIALVAHDARKTDLVSWVRFRAGSLIGCRLFCTGTAGRLVKEALKEVLFRDNDYERIIPACMESYKNRKP